MLFPFSSIRDVQTDFCSDVAYAIADGRHLLAHAPTGLGKTAAALSPALEYALDNGKTVFFLTPRHSQHAIAIETLKKLRGKSAADFQIADIIGKKWLCSVSGIDELASGDFSDFCTSLTREQRCSYYAGTRNKDHALTASAVRALGDLQKEFRYAEEAKTLLADKYCTYEMLTELAKKSKAVIADYYHLFSPARSAMLMRMEKKLEDVIIIIDEAHNLPERIRELMSAKLSTFALRKAEEEAGAFSPDVEETIVTIENALNTLARNTETESYVKKEEFVSLIESADNIDAVIDQLLSAAEAVREHRKKSHIAAAAKFLASWVDKDAGYARILKKAKTVSGKPYAVLTHSCMDPAIFAKDVISNSHSTIAMSGTLQPMDMYKEILGFDERTEMRAYKSPFPKANRLNVVIRETTTKYSKRTEENYAIMADYVVKCACAIPGNCAVFFPSYSMRDKIHGKIKGRIPKKILLEQQNGNKAERRRLYDAFVSYAKAGALLLGVQAGSFSEGVDMPGEFLNGVIIVGIPLEKPDLKTKALIGYYDTKFSRGWDYGYIYPAMIRCLQAAGRCIRSETDRGVAVFIDERFLWSSYRKAFPSDIELRVTGTPEELIKNFWRGK